MIDYDYSLALCYGIVVSFEKMQEFQEVLTDEEYNEVINNYSYCINGWTGSDYFIGIICDLESVTDCVYRISTLSVPSDDNKDLINLKRFFNEHNLWELIDWKPELLLINFCF